MRLSNGLSHRLRTTSYVTRSLGKGCPRRMLQIECLSVAAVRWNGVPSAEPPVFSEPSIQYAIITWSSSHY